jgi:hypothetical protein
MEQNVQRRIRQAGETSSPAASPGRLRVVPRDHNPFIDFGSREGDTATAATTQAGTTTFSGRRKARTPDGGARGRCGLLPTIR